MTKLRVGIVGCGNVALNFHIPAYQALPETFEIVGIADPTPERLALGQQAAALTDHQLHATTDDLIARDDVDVIDVCTPQYLHKDVVVQAVSAGKHVLSEKPLAAVPAEAAEMVSAAASAGVVLGVMHNYLHFPEIIALKSIIDNGEIGAVRTVQLDMLGVIDSAGAAGYRPQWRKDPAASGGGVLMDMLHGVYLAEHLLPEDFDAVSARVDAASGDAVESIAWCRMNAGSSTALVNIGWGLGRGGIAVDGTEGRAIAHYRSDGTMPWAPFEHLEITTDAGTRRAELPAGEELSDLIAHSMRDLVADFADAVKSNGTPLATGTRAHHILESVVAAYGSAALEETVNLPLSEHSPLYNEGVVGVPKLSVPENSPLRKLGVFGLDRAEVRA